jgi:hypothetical protein
MKNPIRSAVVALLLLCAVGAPLASAVSNGAFSKPARLAPVAQPAVAAVAAPAVVELPETVIAAPAPQRRAQARHVASRPQAVRTVGLDQGGRPGARTVTAWGV